jgi:hypothetical protein
MVSPDLGAMLRHGVLAEDESLRERLLKGGLLSAVTPAVLFGLLDYYCDPERGPLLRDFSQICLGLAQPAKLSKTISGDPDHTLNPPMYSHFIHSGKGIITDSGAGSALIKYKAEFLAAEDVNTAGAVVPNALMGRLMGCEAQSVSITEADLSRPLHYFGVDSLMAIELRAWFAKAFAASVPIFETSSEGSAETLSISVLANSGMRR